MDRPLITPRIVAGLTAATGLIALFVTVAFRLLPPVRAAGACLPSDAVIRFEFARSPEDLNAVFGACRDQAVLAVDAVNKLDLAAYIPSYAAFAALAAVFLAGKLRRPLVWVGILAAAVAAVADVIETRTLLEITADFSLSAPLLITSSSAAWVKFAALALNALILAAICLERRPRLWILAGFLTLPALATVAMATSLDRAPLVTYAYLLSWLPILAMAIWMFFTTAREVSA